MDVGRRIDPLVAEAARTWRVGGAPVRAAVVVGLTLMAVGLTHAAAFVVVGGPWQGPVAWRKPFAFGLSFGLTTVTVAWLVARLRVGRRAKWLLLVPFADRSVLDVVAAAPRRAGAAARVGRRARGRRRGRRGRVQLGHLRPGPGA
jgi:hypothetical protein